LLPFYSITKQYKTKLDINQARQVLLEIIRAKYNSIKYSIYGAYLEEKDEYVFYAKHGNWRPFMGEGIGAKIIVSVFSIAGQTIISVRVTTNPVFWLMLFILLFLLFISLTRTENVILYSAICLLLMLVVIAFDRLNKKVLLSLLERYI
jgi:hypothetical protein